METLWLIGCLALVVLLGYLVMRKVGKFLEENPIEEEPSEDLNVEKKE